MNGNRAVEAGLNGAGGLEEDVKAEVLPDADPPASVKDDKPLAFADFEGFLVLPRAILPQ